MFGWLLWVASCGDPQLDAQVRGVPIYSIRGSTQMTGPAPDGALRIALFFSPSGLKVQDPEQLVEQIGTSTALALPSNYVLNVYELPEPQHMIRLAAGADAGYAAGRVLVYVDADGNGRHTPGEAFVGIMGHLGIYYFRDRLDAANIPTKDPLAAGFYRVMLPQPCDFVPPTPTDAGTCGVPIGSTCRADRDCQGGICNLDAPFPWPSGYCTIPDPSPSGCYPGAASYLGAPPEVPGTRPAPPRKGIYLKPCAVDKDCIRADEPQNNAYRCDPGLRGCVPGAPPFVQVGPRINVAPFCAGGS